MEILLPDLLKGAENENYLSPDQYTYWKARENK